MKIIKLERDMKNKIFNFGNKSIVILFNFFFIPIVYFAIVSKNIVLGDNTFFGTSTTWVSLIFILGIICLILLVVVFEKIRYLLWKIIIKYDYITAYCLFFIAIVIQIFFIHYFHPAIGFDAGAIHAALTNTTDAEIRAYYSLNSNNLPILLLQHELTKIFSTNSWLFFDLITLVLVDTSALFNILSVSIIDKKKVPTAIYIHALWLMIFPMISVPYTDTWVLPFVAFYILNYCIIAFGEVSLLIKVIATLFLGAGVTCAYLMKPSSIIGFIAIILVELVYIFYHKNREENKKRVRKKIGFYFILFLFSSLFTYCFVNNILVNQTYIRIDRSRTNPPIHFISMGVSGEGGYNAKDALAMAQLPTKAARVKYSEDKLKERIKNKGVFGYIKFLVQKHSNNTSDGTFSWVKEGNFIAKNQPKTSDGKISKILKSFFYLYGNNIADFRFIAQLWWCAILILIALGWNEKEKFIQVLRLTLVGGFLFLLIFEGGRSRYLIQFLPIILILATLLQQSSIRNIKSIIKWTKLLG